jgi:hypothetical protein
MQVYLSGEATVVGGLKVLELSDAPLVRRPDRIYTTLDLPEADYAAAAADFANGTALFL